METKGIIISPVNMEDRKKLGVKSGDTVRVWQKIQEKGKTRLQAFEGLVLACKHGSEPGATFTVRRVASGVGMEKIFPLYSPMIDKIEIVRRAKVRRAKLYYIREKVAREIRRQMRHMKLVKLSTESDMAEKEKAAQAEEAAGGAEDDKSEGAKEEQSGGEGDENVTSEKENKEETKEEKPAAEKEDKESKEEEKVDST